MSALLVDTFINSCNVAYLILVFIFLFIYYLFFYLFLCGKTGYLRCIHFSEGSAATSIICTRSAFYQVVVTIFRCGGQKQKQLRKISSQKLFQSIDLRLSYLKIQGGLLWNILWLLGTIRGSKMWFSKRWSSAAFECDFSCLRPCLVFLQ